MGEAFVWSREEDGCTVRLYGWESEFERKLARMRVRELEEAVLGAEPRAHVVVFDSGSSAVGISVKVRVSAEELAAFSGGPTHREAIALVREVVNVKLSEFFR